MPPLTLIPLTLHDHTDLLQAVYAATPAYWQLHGRAAVADLQALHDLRAMEETPGRAILGILHPTFPLPPDSGRLDSGPNPGPQPVPSPTTEMIGAIDLRMHHPARGVTTVGLMMIAAPWQRQGHGRAAWSLVEAWLAGGAGMTKARAGIEQFNPGALQFFEALGFTVTGEATRVPQGERLVRLLYTEKVFTR